MEILSVRGVLPEHTYAQQEITDAFAEVIADGGLDESLLRRFHANAGVRQRSLVLRWRRTASSTGSPRPTTSSSATPWSWGAGSWTP